MYKLIDFIERHKYGIIITLMIHVAVFVYFQLATYEEAVLYEAWDFRGKNVESPDDIQITPDQIQTPQEHELFQPQEEVSSFVKNENDKRIRSFDKEIQYTSSTADAESIEDEFNKAAREEIMGNKAEQQKESGNNDDVETDKEKESENNDKGTSGSNEAVGGQTMVSYRLDNRHPLNHNDWYVRNPGYTCGNVNGVVKVLIEVAQSGDVVDAKVLDAQTQNATPCMLERAREYALKSRFNYDGSASKKQQGIITYRFVFRN
tara:strand:+ start:33764 stop:34549 length:786 start_codon:yes stop_codon:yes gene_type:complete